MMRFDRFTERAQDTAMRALEVMQRYGHTQVDVEHLLLALLEQPQGVVPALLAQMGIELEAIAGPLDRHFRQVPRTQIYGGGPGQVYITPRLKRAIDGSNEEALRLKDEYIATEHLFLAIASERKTPAGRILAQAGVTRKRILEALPQVRGALGEQEAERAGRHRAALTPQPLTDVTIEAVTGEEPALVLVQGEDTIAVKLGQVLALVGALSNAAVNLAEEVARAEA
jgi:ATP-dependent Clp protease ATP-binding subunit ClpC